jgi:hypothetical protein
MDEVKKALHLKRPVLLSSFNKTWITATYFFREVLKSQKHPSSGSQVVPRGLT